MRLVVHDLIDTLQQEFTPANNTIVGAVRPHIYLHNNPTGSLKVQIRTADGILISESNEVLFSDITSAPEYHGYVTFNVGANLRAGVAYQFTVVPSVAYSFSESSYCGICNDYDLSKYTPESETIHPMNAPLDFEIWALSKY